MQQQLYFLEQPKSEEDCVPIVPVWTTLNDKQRAVVAALARVVAAKQTADRSPTRPKEQGDQP